MDEFFRGALKAFQLLHSAAAAKTLVQWVGLRTGSRVSPPAGSGGRQRGFALRGALGPPCLAAYEDRQSCRHAFGAPARGPFEGLPDVRAAVQARRSTSQFQKR